ncbi:MAG: hypothetical protein QXO51_07325 [Halobacteria archaeon]
MRVYLDTCAWCRPFDRPSPRILREAQALREILQEADRGHLILVGSPVLEVELDWLGDPEKREAARNLAWKSISNAPSQVPAGIASTRRRLRDLGLTPPDALHVAWAVEARCDVFITTDDGVLKMEQKIGQETGLRVSDPVRFARSLR